jgi:hypothetical protein
MRAVWDGEDVRLGDGVRDGVDGELGGREETESRVTAKSVLSMMERLEASPISSKNFRRYMMGDEYTNIKIAGNAYLVPAISIPRCEDRR